MHLGVCPGRDARQYRAFDTEGEPIATRKRIRKAAASQVEIDAATRLATAFSALAGDLPNIFSEGDPPGRVFHRFVLPMDSDLALTPGTLAPALGVKSPRHIDLEPVTDQLSPSADDWGDEVALGYRLISEAMQATMGPLYMAFARVDPGTPFSPYQSHVPTWIFGRLDGSTLAGLKTVTIET